MRTLSLPRDTKDPIKLADWLELKALLAHDKNASFGDLSSALRLGSTYDSDLEIDEMAGQVWGELHNRVKFAGGGYPFKIEPSYVQLSSDVSFSPYYIFCLCLSFWGAENNDPRKWFEDLACLAAQNYIGGEGLTFGFPRAPEITSPEFAQAINDLCKKMGEGLGYKPPLAFRKNSTKKSTLNTKDGGVDIVAWKNFPDHKESKLILFGQCASNMYWDGMRDKLSDLDPKAFCETYMQDQPLSPIIKAFFTPNCISDDHWEECSRRAGLVFDRCRVAYWAHQDVTSRFDITPHINWIKSLVGEV